MIDFHISTHFLSSASTQTISFILFDDIPVATSPPHTLWSCDLCPAEKCPPTHTAFGNVVVVVHYVSGQAEVADLHDLALGKQDVSCS